MARQTLKFRVSLYLALCLTAALALFTTLVVRHERDELLAAAVDQLSQLSEVIIIDSTHAAELGLLLDRRAEGCLSCHQGDAARERIGDNDRARIFTNGN